MNAVCIDGCILCLSCHNEGMNKTLLPRKNILSYEHLPNWAKMCFITSSDSQVCDIC